jgi:hypothetical protein
MARHPPFTIAEEPNANKCLLELHEMFEHGDQQESDSTQRYINNQFLEMLPIRSASGLRCGHPSHIPTWLESTNTTLAAEINIFHTDNPKLQREKKGTKKHVNHLHHIHSEVLALARDQYDISLPTLVDGVLHLAGWTGAPTRGDFIWA